MDEKYVVLIVDDTPENLRVLGDMLEQEGHEVMVATNGPDALENARANPAPDLILLDIMMPDMDGYEVCRRLKSDPATKAIPVIFISALGMAEQKVQGFREGAVDYVCKPFQAEEVIARVHTHIQLAHMEELKREIAERKKVETQLLEQVEIQRELREQIIQQQKLDSIGLLAGGIAHDFNNMLTPIFGYAEMIRKKSEPDDKINGYAESILNAANKAKVMVKQLMSFSRKQAFSAECHDMNEVVPSFIKMLENTIRENIVIQVSPCSAPCLVSGDRAQIEQIMLNLLVNAQDAISANGTIAVETGHAVLDDEYCRHHLEATPGSYITLIFTDSGSGMDENVLSRIFEPFFTTKPVGKGTGLGLSTVFGIIKQHGGYIEVQSSVGIGTTFRVYLPEHKGEVLDRVQGLPEREGGIQADATILLVEDSQVLLEYIQTLLNEQGYTVLAAESPEAALALAREAKDISLLLSDVVMPQMTGPELYERLLKILPNLNALFMSGYPDSVVISQGYYSNIVDFIAKPFTCEELLKHVSSDLSVG